jgi:hypothetical protein
MQVLRLVRRGGFLSQGWESTNPERLWFPTHFAKNAKWMGHGAIAHWASSVGGAIFISASALWQRLQTFCQMP